MDYIYANGEKVQDGDVVASFTNPVDIGILQVKNGTILFQFDDNTKAEVLKKKFMHTLNCSTIKVSTFALLLRKEEVDVLKAKMLNKIENMTPNLNKEIPQKYVDIFLGQKTPEFYPLFAVN